MNAEDQPVAPVAPVKSVAKNAEKRGYDWTARFPDGRTFTGYASTEADAWVDMNADWRVRGEKVRYVGQRTPRGGITPDLDDGEVR